jgi:hypothetical protein
MKFPLVSALCAGVFVVSPAQAEDDVVLFDFTGVISTSLLYSGMMQTLVPSTLPSSWIGQMVNGTVSIDLGEVPTTDYPELGLRQASKTAYFPYTDWMQVTVHQPDGSTITIPSGPAPVPYPTMEGDDAYSQIQNSATRDSFYVGRSFSNGGDSYPQQTFTIDLDSVSGGLGLTDSFDYRSVHFDPLQANRTNAGLVTKLDAAGVGYQYGFQVLTLNQSVAAAVPEPGTWLLMAAGLTLVAWRRKSSRR